MKLKHLIGKRAMAPCVCFLGGFSGSQSEPVETSGLYGVLRACHSSCLVGLAITQAAASSLTDLPWGSQAPHLIPNIHLTLVVAFTITVCMACVYKLLM